MEASRAVMRRATMDIPYGDDPLQKIDFYPAPQPPPHKLVVFLHGGGWVTGNRRGGRQLALPFNQAGYTFASIGYRLVPQTDIAGGIADVASAVSYLLRHAAGFQIEAAGCTLMGHSSGAHMAALLATDPTHLRAAGIDTACLGAIVALDGVYDVAAFLDESTRPAPRQVFGDDPAGWDRYSPLKHVATMTADPAFCLMYEDSNPRFGQQAGVFQAALQAHGKRVASAVAPGLKHAELMLLFKTREQPMQRFVMGHLARYL